MSSFAWIRYKDYLDKKEDKEEYREKWEKNFRDNKKQEPYSLGIPLDEMDFDVYYDYFFPQVIAPIGSSLSYTKSIILPCDVEYYNSKSDQDPIFILKKGTKIFVTTD